MTRAAALERLVALFPNAQDDPSRILALCSRLSDATLVIMADALEAWHDEGCPEVGEFIPMLLAAIGRSRRNAS